MQTHTTFPFALSAGRTRMPPATTATRGGRWSKQRDRSDDNDISKLYRYSSAVAFFILPFLPFFIFLPFPCMMYSPVLRKCPRLEDSRQPSFFFFPEPHTRLRTVIHCHSSDLPGPNSCATRHGKRTSISTYLPSSFSPTCTCAYLDVP